MVSMAEENETVDVVFMIRREPAVMKHFYLLL